MDSTKGLLVIPATAPTTATEMKMDMFTMGLEKSALTTSSASALGGICPRSLEA